jgi:hypothetical protein
MLHLFGIGVSYRYWCFLLGIAFCICVTLFGVGISLFGVGSSLFGVGISLFGESIVGSFFVVVVEVVVVCDFASLSANISSVTTCGALINSTK